MITWSLSHAHKDASVDYGADIHYFGRGLSFSLSHQKFFSKECFARVADLIAAARNDVAQVVSRLIPYIYLYATGWSMWFGTMFYLHRLTRNMKLRYRVGLVVWQWVGLT